MQKPKLKSKSASSRSYVHCIQLENDTEVSYTTIPGRNEYALTSNKRKTLASAPTSSLSEKIRDMASFSLELFSI